MTKKASPRTPLCDRPNTAGLSAARSQPYGKQDGPDSEDLEQDAREGAHRLPGPRKEQLQLRCADRGQRREHEHQAEQPACQGTPLP